MQHSAQNGSAAHNGSGRREDRVPLEASIELRGIDLRGLDLDGDQSDPLVSADGLNVSIGGIAMHAPVAPALGSVVECSFLCPPLGEPVCAQGEVVWTDQKGPETSAFGLRFVELDTKSATALRRYLRPGTGHQANVPRPRTATIAIDGVNVGLEAELKLADDSRVVLEVQLHELQIGRGVVVTVPGRGNERGRIASVELRHSQSGVPTLVYGVLLDDAPGRASAVPITSGLAPLFGVRAQRAVRADSELHTPTDRVEVAELDRLLERPSSVRETAPQAATDQRVSTLPGVGIEHFAEPVAEPFDESLDEPLDEPLDENDRTSEPPDEVFDDELSGASQASYSYARSAPTTRYNRAKAVDPAANVSATSTIPGWPSDASVALKAAIAAASSRTEPSDAAPVSSAHASGDEGEYEARAAEGEATPRQTAWYEAELAKLRGETRRRHVFYPNTVPAESEHDVDQPELADPEIDGDPGERAVDARGVDAHDDTHDETHDDTDDDAQLRASHDDAELSAGDDEETGDDEASDEGGDNDELDSDEIAQAAPVSDASSDDLTLQVRSLPSHLRALFRSRVAGFANLKQRFEPALREQAEYFDLPDAKTRLLLHLARVRAFFLRGWSGLRKSTSQVRARKSRPLRMQRSTLPGVGPLEGETPRAPQTARIAALALAVVGIGLGVYALAPRSGADRIRIPERIEPEAVTDPTLEIQNDDELLDEPQAASEPKPRSAVGKRKQAREPQLAELSAVDEPAAAVPSVLSPPFGEAEVPNGRVFTLRMNGPVQAVEGEVREGGFTVRVPGRLALDRASPIATSHRAVARALILNRGGFAELTVDFIPGASPRFQVRGRDNTLEVTLERP